MCSVQGFYWDPASWWWWPPCLRSVVMSRFQFNQVWHWLDQNSLFEILTIQTVCQWAIQLWIWILDEILELHYKQLYLDFKTTGGGSRLFIWVELPLGHHQFSRHWGLPCWWSWCWWGCDVMQIEYHADGDADTIYADNHQVSDLLAFSAYVEQLMMTMVMVSGWCCWISRADSADTLIMIP